MNTQINIRFSDDLLSKAQKQAKSSGFGTVQEFIRETVREKLFEEKSVSKKELQLINQLIKTIDKRNDYGTEEELFKTLRS